MRTRTPSVSLRQASSSFATASIAAAAAPTLSGCQGTCGKIKERVQW